MSKHFQKVLNALKTSEEVKALGFDKEEIKRLASNIDKKLNLKEDASDEEVESAIEESVDDAIPYLKLAQSQASRIVKKKLEKAKKTDEDDEDDEDDDGDGNEEDEDGDNDDEPAGKPAKKHKNPRKPKSDDDETKKLLKSLLKKMEKQEETIASMRKGNAKDKWRKKLEKAVENTGSFGKQKLREFDRLEFASEDDFDEYLSEVGDDLDEANQERANAGLEKLGLKTAPSAKKDNQVKEVEPYKDEEIDKLAESL